MLNSSQRNGGVISGVERLVNARHSLMCFDADNAKEVSVCSGLYHQAHQALALTQSIEQALLSAERDVAAVHFALTTAEGEAVRMEAYRDRAEVLNVTADEAKMEARLETNDDRHIVRAQHCALVASATATKSLELKEQTPSTERLKFVASSGQDAAEQVRLASVLAAEAKVDIRSLVKSPNDGHGEKQVGEDLVHRVDACAERIFYLQEFTQQNASKISKRCRQALAARTQGDTAVMRTVRVSKDISREATRYFNAAEDTMSTSEMSVKSDSSSDSSSVSRSKHQDTNAFEFDVGRAPERKRATRAAAVTLRAQRDASRAKMIDSTSVSVSSVPLTVERSVPVEETLLSIEPPFTYAHAGVIAKDLVSIGAAEVRTLEVCPPCDEEQVHVCLSCQSPRAVEERVSAASTLLQADRASLELSLCSIDATDIAAADVCECEQTELVNEVVSDANKLFVLEHTHEEQVEEHAPVSVHESGHSNAPAAQAQASAECLVSQEGQNLRQLENLQSFCREAVKRVDDLVQRCMRAEQACNAQVVLQQDIAREAVASKDKEVTPGVRVIPTTADSVLATVSIGATNAECLSSLLTPADKMSVKIASLDRCIATAPAQESPTHVSDVLDDLQELCSTECTVAADTSVFTIEDTTFFAATEEAPAAEACDTHLPADNEETSEVHCVPIAGSDGVSTAPAYIPPETSQEVSEESGHRTFPQCRHGLVVDTGDDASMTPQAPDVRSVHDKDAILTDTTHTPSHGRLYSPKAVWEIVDDVCVVDSPYVKPAPVHHLQQRQEAACMAQAEVEHWSMVAEKTALSAESILRSAEEAARVANQAHALAQQELSTFTEYRTFAEETYTVVREALQVIANAARLCEEEERCFQLHIQTSDDALMAAQAAIEEELSLLSEPVLLDDSDAAVMMWLTERASVTEKIAVQMENMLAAACRREEAARDHTHHIRNRAHANVIADKTSEVTERVAAAFQQNRTVAMEANVVHAAQLAREASERSHTVAYQASQVQVELRAALELADGAVETFQQTMLSLEAECSNNHDIVGILFHHTQRRFDAARGVSAYMDEIANLNQHTQQLVQNVFTACDNSFAAKNNGDALVAHCRNAAVEANVLTTQARQAEARMIAGAEAALMRAQECLQTSRQALQRARTTATEAEEARSAAETAAQHSTRYGRHKQAAKETHVTLSPQSSPPQRVSPYVSPPQYSPDESRNSKTKGQAALVRVQALRHTLRGATASAEEWTLSAEKVVYDLQHAVQTCEVAADMAREAASITGIQLASAKTFLVEAKKICAKVVAGVQGARAATSGCEEAKRVLAKRITIADNVLQDEQASVEEELHLSETTFATTAASGRLLEKSQGAYVAQRSQLLSRVHVALVRREQQAQEHVALARASTTAEEAQKHSDRVAFSVSEAICLQPMACHSDNLTRAEQSSAQAVEQVNTAAASAFESNHEVHASLEETRKACDVALHAAMDLRVWKAECDKLGVDCAHGELQNANNMPWFTQRCREAARQVEEMTNHILMLQELTQHAVAQVAQQSQQINNIRSEAELAVRRVAEASREASALAVRARQMDIEMTALAEAALARARIPAKPH